MSTLELENIKHPDNSGNNIALASNGSITIDRKSTDGSIIEFRKDGTTVGKIGIQSSGFYIDGESGHEGLRFANGTVTPRENGADSDGSSDLGASNNRWKDAYLSGGVYLGGTGSANKLDDYEEGTWTPSTLVNGFTQSVTSYSEAKYTKIGRTVHASCAISLSASGYASGYSHIGGLPFTAVGTSVHGRYASGSISGGGNGGAVFVQSGGVYLFRTFGVTSTSGAWSTGWYLNFTYEA
jgi:hypothetical protein